jgi:enolase
MTHDIIAAIHAREVLDSRGNPTVEVEVRCRGGALGSAIVPSGASTGQHEAIELRDGDPARYAGKGVRRAVAHVKDEIASAVVGMRVTDQAAIDRRLCELDGTPNKSRLGANAILGVSLAAAQAAAASARVPLWRHLASHLPASFPKPSMPTPMVNMISGGLHAGKKLDFQDYLLIPVGAKSYSQALELIVAVYRSLGKTLRKAGYESALVGDEGGFGPDLPDNETALEMICEAIQAAGHEPGRDAAIALDVASTHFFDLKENLYHVRGRSGPKKLSSGDMTDWLTRLVQKYPIISIEDGLAEDDWTGWQRLTQALGAKVQLIGDDLFVTNAARLQQGFDQLVANCVLVKVNQIGTLTETLDVLRLAYSAGYRAVISARSGESEDSFIADLAVATGAGQIKIGSITRSERLAKYNRLLRIEEEMAR